VASNEQVPHMMMQVTIWSDGTLTIDGRAKQDAVPYILRQIADTIDSGQTPLIDLPMN
jgi:hypothetical protein